VCGRRDKILIVSIRLGIITVMISKKYFAGMPRDGALLRDLLNWFIIGCKNMHKHCSKESRYYSGSIDIGYCGSDLSDCIDSHIEISLNHTGSWGVESFEQTSISVPTKFNVESHHSFFAEAGSLNDLADLTRQVKENSIFSDLLLKKISGHQICFGEHNG
jgi:hypothetical protein